MPNTPAPSPWVSRVQKYARKVIEFDGTSGNGAVGTVKVFDTNGAVMITRMAVLCEDDLAGSSATVALGTAGNTGGLVAQTTATEIDAEEFWHGTSPALGVANAVTEKAVNRDVIITVGTDAVTAGKLVVVAYYHPVTADGTLS